MERTTPYAPRELRRVFADYAKGRNRSGADVIREAIAAYVNLAGHRLPPFIEVGADDEITGARRDFEIVPCEGRIAIEPSP